MKTGSISLQTNGDGSVVYKARITRGGETHRLTHDSLESAQKWLKKMHYKCADQRMKLKQSLPSIPKVPYELEGRVSKIERICETTKKEIAEQNKTIEKILELILEKLEMY